MAGDGRNPTRAPRMALNRRGGAAVWLLLSVGAVIAALAGAGFYITQNYEKLIAAEVARTVKSTVSASGLSREDKAGIIAIVERLRQDYLEGRVTLAELQSVLKALASSPVLPAGLIAQFEASYVLPSGIDPGEKEAARIDLNRFTHGLCTRQIGWEAVHEATAPISESDISGKRRLKAPAKCRPEEIRRVLASIRAACDRAEIPPAMAPVDIAGEFRKSVETALGRQLV